MKLSWSLLNWLPNTAFRRPVALKQSAMGTLLGVWAAGRVRSFKKGAWKGNAVQYVMAWGNAMGAIVATGKCQAFPCLAGFQVCSDGLEE